MLAGMHVKLPGGGAVPIRAGGHTVIGRVDVGASAYITTGTFDQKALVEALRRLV